MEETIWPLISVIVPVYNAEKYLKRCIDSIIDQNYPAYEILLIDDGSKDSSGKICDAYEKECVPVKVIHQENAGVSTARNRGIDAAKGEYVTFVDSDDYIEKDHLAELQRLLKSYSADIAISPMRIVHDEAQNDGSAQGNEAGQKLSGIETAQKMLYQDGLDGRSCGMLIPAAMAKRFLFPEGVICAEDLYTVFRYYINSSAVVLGGTATYNYYQNKDSVMHTASPKKIRDSLRMADKIVAVCETCFPELLAAAQAKQFSNYCQALIELEAIDIEDESFMADLFMVALKSKAYSLRRQMLTDKRTRVKNKIAALVLYFGTDALRQLFRLKNKSAKERRKL